MTCLIALRRTVRTKQQVERGKFIYLTTGEVYVMAQDIAGRTTRSGNRRGPLSPEMRERGGRDQGSEIGRNKAIKYTMLQYRQCVLYLLGLVNT